tara:strand:+ start:529 stop:1116 length:588 start_codon:yes stop_codon:yes gene_type:complete
MSQIKLKHSGGNSVIIAAPASNPSSDVTLKLPQADGSAGQVLKTDGSGNLSFVNQFSDGQVLKTQHDLWSNEATTTSTSLAATGLSIATNTPESSLNDHLILIRIADLRKSGDNAIQVVLYKNGSFFQTFGNYLQDTSSSVQQTFTLSGVVYDSADDSSSATYQVYWKSATGATIYANVGNGQSEMIVQEIKRYS